jgi:hypothetical protein
MIGHTMDQKYIHTAEYTAQQWLCILNYKDKQELMPYYIEALYAISKAYTETMPNSMSGLALLQQCALLSPEPIYKVEFLNCLIGFMDGSPTAKAVDLNERIKELTTQVAQHKDYIRSIEALNKQRDHFFNPQSVSGLVKRCLTLFGPKPNPKQEAATSANASPSESGASPP